MIFNRAEMLNKRANRQKFKIDEMFKKLPISKGAVIADIGCGGGCFTMRFAEMVGQDGKVYAVDINEKYLAYVGEYIHKKQITNIELVKVDGIGLNLPDQSCDLIFLRNVLHHIEDRTCYFENMKRYLRPKGKVAIIEYKGRTGLNFITLWGHYVEEEVILRTMKNTGYTLVNSCDFLPEQSYNIFELN